MQFTTPHQRVSRPFKPVLLFLLALMLFAAQPPALAQEAQKAEFELDLTRMLYEQTAGSVQDPVWQITARKGSKLVLVPFRTHAVTGEVKLSRPPFSVRSGRLIGFYVPSKQMKPETASTGPDLRELTKADAKTHERLLFAKPDPEKEPLVPPTDIDTPDEGAGDKPPADEPDAKDGPGENAADKSDKPGPAPKGAPRLTREVFFYPDGTIAWEVDRVFHSATLQSAGEQNLYPYKINPRLWEKVVPEKPKRGQGADARDKYREDMLAYREKVKAYRDLRNTVNELPTEFREPAPPVVYAIYEWVERGDLTLQGGKPLPWELNSKSRERMVALAQNKVKPDTVEGKQELDAITALLKDKHPLTERAVAIAVMRGKLVSQVVEDDEGFKLVARLLDSKDTTARRVAQYAVARTEKPSRASARLLEGAGFAAQGYERDMLRFAALRTLFNLEAANPESTGVLAAKVGAAIADTKGPGAGFVLESLFEAQTKAEAFKDPKTAGGIIDGITKRVDLGQVPKAQSDALIKAIVGHAPTNPVAGALLDKQLLRSKNKALAISTLVYLSEQARLKMKKRYEQQSQAKKEQPADGVLSAGQQKPTTIPIYKMDHGLLAMLKVGAKAEGKEPENVGAEQQAAVHALGMFHVAKDTYRPEGSGVGIGTHSPMQIFTAVLDHVKAMPKPSPALVLFMSDQPDQSVQDFGLRQLLGMIMEPKTDSGFVAFAVKEVVSSNGRFNQAIGRMNGTDQAKLARGLYRVATKQKPSRVVTLIAESSSRMSRWFLDQLKQGDLPEASRWASQAADENSGGEKNLIGMLADDNEEVAVAAATALVMNAGGNAEDQQGFIKTIVELSKRDRKSVDEAWAKRKKELHARVLAKARGTYQMYATVGKLADQPGYKSRESAHGAEEPADKPETKAAENPEGVVGTRINLGLVELRASDASVSLSVQAVKLSMTPNRVGIRIDEIASLKTFGKTELSGLDAESLAGQSLDLLPVEKGVWAGRIELKDGVVIGVALVPTK